MSCLLPQFKCPSDAFSVYPKTHHLTATTYVAKVKDSSHFRTQCMLSSTSAAPPISSNTMQNMEKLQLTSLEEHLNPAAALTPWTYIGGNSLADEVNFRAALSTEERPTDLEAVVGAAEALALAKAAVKVAKDAVLMAGNKNTVDSDKKHTIFTSESDSNQLRRTQFSEAERFDNLRHSLPETGSRQDNSINNFFLESTESEPTLEELELLQEQLSSSISVRSKRRTERKARREKAAEKSAARVVPTSTVSYRRKKRPSSIGAGQPDVPRILQLAYRTKVLTAAEEIVLSEGIQDLIKLERLHEECIDRCGGPPTFAQWAAAAGVHQKILKQRLNYGARCKEQMVNRNIRLVLCIARTYLAPGINMQDLVQEGCRGLMKAAEKYDSSKGFKFSTYAHWWIKESVRKSLTQQYRIIRLPTHMVDADYKAKEARKQMRKATGKEPSDIQVSEATGITMSRINAIRLIPKFPRSLDEKIGFDNNLKLTDIISHPNAETSEELLSRELMKQDLEKMLDSLTPKEKKVVRLRYGLDDGRMKTLQEIGDSMGVSRERIRQLESCAFRKLTSKKRIEHLQQYLDTAS